MKKYTYKMGKFGCRTYFKTAGSGYEVGAYFGSEKVFTGNFIHKTEANQYWTLLNKDMKTFCAKYWVTQKAPVAWYQNFMKNYIYKNYYKFLDTKFGRYQREYSTAVRKHESKYHKLRRNWETSERLTLKNAA